MAIRKNILVKGFIQDVSYREQTQQVARHLGVKGWVRSVGHGTVEACFEGDQRSLAALTGQSYERIPVYLLMSDHTARTIGVSVADYQTSAWAVPCRSMPRRKTSRL